MTKTSQTRVLFQRTLSRFRMGVFAAFVVSGVALSVASLVIDRPAQAATASTLNFQARLLNNSGSIVTDGKYNVQFKLYNVANGGTALWTETYYDTNGAAAGNDNRVSVRAGYLSVYLGSLAAFPGNINWDQDLYLTMNIGGTTQTTTPTYDGEMNPRIKLTAVPYAFKAGQLAQLNAATGFTSTLKLAQPTVGNQDFIIPDQGAAGTYTLLTSAAADAAYIQNQNTLQQASAQFWISGSGRADTSFLTPAVDTATAGTLTIGATNATAVSIAKTGVATTVNGSLTVTEDATFNGNVAISGSNTLTVGTGATTLGGTLTVNGAQFTNSGATLNTAKSLSDQATGVITDGTTPNLVDVHTTFTINQTTSGQSLSLPAPTDTTAGRIVYVSNVGTANFTMHSTVVAAGGNATFLWNGTMWRTIVDSGISAVGTLDSQTKSADGAVVVGSGLYLQTADANFPGLVSTGTQTFAGNKTFVGGVLFKPAVDSNFALEVQGSGGGRIMRVDSTNQKVAIGAYSQTAGNTITGQFEVTPTNANRNAIVVIGATGQLGDYYNASLAGANIFRVQSSGNIQTASGVFMSNSQSADATNSNSASFKSGDVSGANAASGVATFSSGNSTTSGNTGSVTLKSGNATSGNSGGVTVDAGTASGTAGQIYIGTTNASTVNIARTGVLTTVYGALTVNGTQFTNNGATLNVAKALNNQTNGTITDGVTANLVDVYTTFTINQTTGSQTLSLPAPTTTTAGRIVYISNIGNASFTMHSIVVNAGGNAAFLWNGSAWKPTIDAGISAVGTLDGQPRTANGATVVGSALYLQTADATNAGLMGTGDQTFSGNKTFNGLITGNAGATVSGGAISLTGNAASSFTTTAGDLTLQAGSGTIQLGSTTKLNAGGALTIATGLSGALTLDATGAAINVGGATTIGINLQQNTTVASGKNFTVTNGATSLTGATTGNSTAVTVNSGATTNVGLLVQGVASQAADLLQVKANGVAAPVLGVTATGAATFRNTVDGTNALQILNAVGNNIVSVGTGTSYTMLLGHSGTGVRGQIGTAVSGIYQGNSTVTNSFNFAKSVPNNHTLIGSLVLSAAAAPTVSVTDSKGNSYVVHVQTTSGSNVALAIFSGVISTPLTTADTITVTISSGTGRWLLDVQEFDNILTSGAVDRTATNTNTSIAFSSGVTAITQQANELVFGAFGYNSGRTFTPTNGFTASTQLSTSAGTNDRSLSNLWKFVTTTGTQEATGTVNTSGLYAGGVVTFRSNVVDNGAAAKIAFNDGSSNGFVASLGFSNNLSGNRDIYLPDASGTLCLDSGNCSAAGGYIVNGTALQTGNFNISGTGTAGISFLAPLLDTAAAGTLSLGTSNATAVSIAKAGVATTVNGTLSVAQATTIGGNLTLNGTQFTNNGSTLNTAKALNDQANGTITDGTPTNLVDAFTAFTINQTSGSRTLSLPNPTATTAGRIVYVSNIGTASFTMHNIIISAGSNASFIWNGSAWKASIDSGISAIGTLDGQSRTANGATVVGSGLYLQTADATHAGLMGTGDQTFAGNKTFNGTVTISGAGTGLSVANSASVGANLTVGGNVTVTGSISGNGVNAGTGLLQGAGGMTITGAADINTTGTASTSIGNATGTFALQSSGLNVSTSGALTGVSGITTTGGYSQTGSSTNDFSGVSNFTAAGTALSVNNSASVGGSLTVGQSLAVGGSAVSGAQLSATSTSTSQVVAAIKGMSGQTANLLQLQNGNNDILASFSNTGQLTLGRISASGTTAAGVLTFADGTNSGFGATVTSSTLTANRSFLLPDSSLATTASPATLCVFNGTVSNCPTAAGSPYYIQNGTTVQSSANFYIRSASASSVAGVLEGAVGQTADLLDLNSFNGTTSTTVARITAAGNLQVAGSVDTTTAVALNLGTANASSVVIADSGVSTTVNGTLTVAEAATFNGNVSITGVNTLTVGGATTVGGALTVNGTQLTNAGATLNTAKAYTNFASDAPIDTAAQSVDIKTAFTINQTTASRTLSLPAPTNTAAGRVVYVSNIGSASFTMNNAVVPAGGNAVFLWNGSAWKPTVEAGISAVGNLDAQPKNADGATVFAGALYLQTADATHPGLVSTGDQTFAGNKTFNGTVTISGAGTGLSVANDASIGGNLTVTGSISGNGVNAGTGLLQGTGGLTVTGATNINTTGTASTTIGNTSGTFSVESANFDVSASGAINTNGGYTQNGGSTNTFSGVTSFTAAGTALSVTNNLSAGTINNLSLTSQADGFTIAGGTVSRTLTVNGNITIGSVIQPTSSGTLAIRSNGANDLTLDAGGAARVDVGAVNANSVNISRSGVTTTVGGALTVQQALTGNAGATVSGGAVSLTANAASSFTTSAGALTLTSAAATTWSTTAGNLTIQAGSGTVSLGTSSNLTASGALTVTSGGATTMTVDAGGAASLNLGTANANGVSISRTGVATTVNGTLTVAEAATFNGSVDVTGANTFTVGTGATTLGGTLAVAGNTTLNGAQFTNNGSTVNGALALGNITTGTLGTAAATVDVKTAFTISQSTTNQTITIPAPTNTAAGRIVYISNLGPASFTMYGVIVTAGSNASFVWNGSAWSATTPGGVTALGSVDGQARTATGGAIVGSLLYLQTADATHPGLMGTGDQTFAGNKTFNGTVTVAGAGGLSVTNGASIGGNLTVTGSISGTGVNSGTGLIQGTGGMTVTGATNINTTGTASTTIGNTTGSLILESANFDVTAAGNITTAGTYTQTGTGTNTFAGLTNFTAAGTGLSVTNNLSAGTINSLSLASQTDGFTVAGGTTSRTLTVTGADITIGNVIRPTDPGSLAIRSNGGSILTLDAGGAAPVNVGVSNASSVSISKSGATTTVNGALTVSELLTGNGGATVSGGAISLSGNAASSLTTSSGALTLTSAAATTWSTTAGNLTIQAGSGTVSLGTSTNLTASGALTVTSGGATTMTVDAGGAQSLNLGTANANAVSISRTGVATTINGSLTVTQASTFNGNVSISDGKTFTVGTGASTFGGTLTVNGAQFTNGGATLNTAGATLSDFATNQAIGTAATTVDVKTSFVITQTTSGVTLSLPNPTNTAAGRIVYIMNRGSAAFTMHNIIVNAGSNAAFLWNGAAWKPTADAGIAAVGTINSQTKSLNGAVVVGSGLYLQTADANFPGLVSTIAQTFAGDKTFSDTVTINGAGLGLNVAHDATIGGTLGVTGDATFNGNITQNNAGSFTTGTGSVNLNGNVAIADGRTLTVGTGASTFGGTLTVVGDATFNGSQLTNNGATLNTAKALNDQANGTITDGVTANLVDVYTTFTINQTTGGRTLSLPTPTNATAGRIVYVSNRGSANFTIGGAVIVPGATIGFMWNGVAWTATGSGTGATIVGTLDNQTKSPDGAVISGNTLYLQTADQTTAGLVSSLGQTFGGAKTFANLITGNAGLTVSGGAVSLSGNAASSFTTTSGSLSLQGFGGVTISTPNAAGTTSPISIATGNATAAGNSGTVTIKSGNASSGTAGNVSIDTGTSSTGSAQVTIGTSSAGAVSIGRSGFTTTVNGALTAQQLLTGNAGATIGGGAISLSGNTNSSFTTSSGALTLTSAAAATWSTTAGNLTIQAGSGTVSLGTSSNLTANGALAVRSGGATTMTVDAGGAASLSLGTANANGVSISRTGVTTAINGALTVAEAASFNGNVSIADGRTFTVGNGASNLGGTLTVAGNTTLNGAQFTNNGATLNTAKAYTDFASNAQIDTAANSVDTYTAFTIDQDTPNITLSLPAPTDTTPGRIVYVSNIGTQAVVISNLAIAAGSNGTFLWNGSAWKGATEGGASTIGTLDGNLPKSANGASIVGNLFYFQTADANFAGLMGTGDQTFAGNKTFNGTVTVAGAGGLSVTNSASIGGNLTVTGSISGTGVNSGTGLIQGTGGMTVTGTTNINTTGTANTTIGNTTGSLILESANFDVSSAGTITTAGGYNQSGSVTNSFTGVTSFTAAGNALSVTNNISTGTINNLTLTRQADGFTVAGGTTSRTLTVTGASITIGNIIQPTNPGTLAISSNGANALTLDSGGAAPVNLGTGSANAVSIGRSSLTTTVNGALTAQQLLTGNGGATIGGGAVSLTGNAASSFSTTAGALTLTSAAATTWSTTAGDLTIQAGSGTVSLGTSSNLTANGALTITSGGATTMTVDAGGAQSLNLGTANASGVSISRTGVTTAINGGLTVAQNATFSGQVGIGTTPSRSLHVAVNDANVSGLPFLLEQNGTGDVGLELKNPSQGYYVGIDATDNAFKISSSANANPSDKLSNSIFQLDGTGKATFQNTSNTAAAFTVQNNLGNQIFSVDTSNSQIVLGKASSINGRLTFQNSSNANTATIASGATSTSYTLTLPTALGGAGQCLVDTNGSGALGFTSCVTTTVTLQSAYNNSTATAPEFKLDSTHGGLDIQDANTALDSATTNFISLRGSNSTGLGNIRFSVSTNGNLYMKPAADSFNLVEVRRAANNAGIFVLDSINSRLGLALGGTGTSPTLPSFTLDVGGDINTSTRIMAPTHDTAASVTMNVGTVNATAISIAQTGVATTVNGSLTVTQATTFNGNVSITGANTLTVGTGLTQLGGNLTVAGTTSLNGTQLTNAGATVNTAKVINDVTADGDIDVAATSVDVKTTFTINQLSGAGSRILTLPTPTNTAAGRIAYVSNIGTADFTMHGVSVVAGTNASFIWNGSAWAPMTRGGVTAMGALDGQARNANGATILGSSLYLQTADGTNPGLVSAGTQTFGGDKTFNGTATFAASGTGLSVTNNASVGGNLTVTGSISGTGVNSGTGLIQGTGGMTVTGTTNINTGSSTANTSIGNTTGSFSLQSSSLTIGTNGNIGTSGTYTQNGTGANSFGGVTTFTAANGVVLGASNTATGGIVFRGAGGFGTLTLAGPTTPNTGNYTLSIPAITGNQSICVSGTVCAGYQAAPATGSFLYQSPTTTGANTITPAAGVIGLTVNGPTSSGVVAMVVNQSQATDGMAIQLTNMSGSQTNGLSISRNAAGSTGSTSNLLSLSNPSGNGSVGNAIDISGSFTNSINAPNFTVTSAGAVTGIGVNAGTGLLQGTGGITVSGAAQINTTGSANTSIGNAAGTITLESASFDLSSVGTITTAGGYNQSGNVTNSFTGVTSFTAAGSALSVTNNISTGTINNLTLTSGVDGYSISGGAASRTLTIVGANITVGNVIQPTSAGTLAIQSNGAFPMTVDAGGADKLNLGLTNASGVDISRTGMTTAVKGAFTVAQDTTLSGNFTQNGVTTFSTGQGTVSLNGNTSVTGSNTLTVGGTLTVNGTQFTNNGSTLNGVKNMLNFGTSGSFGLATDTVDIKTAFIVPQTTSGVSLTLPDPTVTTAGRIIYISNKGNQSFDVSGTTIPVNSTYSFMWNGAAWTYTGASAGVNAVGTYDSPSISANANGATVQGSTIYFQSATQSLPGMVSAGAQYFGGPKTFVNLITGSAGISVSGGAINLGGNTNSQITTSGSATLTLTSAAAAIWSTGSGDLTIQGGSGTVSLGVSNMLTANSALTIRSGGANGLTVDTGGLATLSLGTTFANAINIGRSSVTTTNQGHFSSLGNTTLGATGTGALLTNNGATLNTTLDLTNVASGGNLSSPAQISSYTMFRLTQSSAATLSIPTPNVSTPGRIIYVSNSSLSTANVTLNLSVGAVVLAPGSTMTLIWNGNAWTAAGGANTVGTFDNQTPSANGATFIGNTLYLQSATSSAPGLVSTGAQTFAGLKTFNGGAIVTTTSATAFQVQNADGANSLTVDTSTPNNLAINGGAENSVSFGANWVLHGNASAPQRVTSSGDMASGLAAVRYSGSTSGDGVRNVLGAPLTPGTAYNVSFSVKSTVAWPIGNVEVRYYNTSSSQDTQCTTSNQVSSISTTYVKYTCQVTPSLAGDNTAFLVIRQTDGVSRTVYIDNLSIVAQNTNGFMNSNRLIVGGDNSQGLTIFTLDKSAGPPQAGNGGSTINPSLFGSMYFDTGLGRIQCYEANGWGSCGNVPDVSVNLIPEYTGAVLNGTGIGTMTASLCSGSSRLIINTTICGASEDYNYYAWTSPQPTNQTYSIYVRYQLPANFKDFASDTTIQLTARTSSAANGSVSYTMFRPDGTTCGSSTPTPVTSLDNTWQTQSLGGDERTCTVTNGGTIGPNSIVLFKIDVTAKSNATVYVSNLSFLTKGK